MNDSGEIMFYFMGMFYCIFCMVDNGIKFFYVFDGVLFKFKFGEFVKWF